LLNIDSKISPLPIWHYILQLLDVCWCNQRKQ